MKTASQELSSPQSLGYMNVLRTEFTTRKNSTIRFTIKRLVEKNHIATALVDIRVHENGSGTGFGVRLYRKELQWFVDNLKKMASKQKTGVNVMTKENNRTLELNYNRSDKAVNFRYFNLICTANNNGSSPDKTNKLCLASYLVEKFLIKAEEILNLFKFSNYADIVFGDDKLDEEFRVYLATGIVALQKLQFTAAPMESMDDSELKSNIEACYKPDYPENINFFKRVLMLFEYQDNSFAGNVIPHNLDEVVAMLKSEEEPSNPKLAEAIFTALNAAVMEDDLEDNEEWKLLQKERKQQQLE